MVDVRPPQQHPSHRAGPDRPGTRRHRRGHGHHLRGPPAGADEGLGRQGMTAPAPAATVLYSVAEPDPEAPAVRADLEWVGRMLRESLDRQEGPALSALVQEVQHATRASWPHGPPGQGSCDGPESDGPETDGREKADARLATVLAGVDLATEILLV